MRRARQDVVKDTVRGQQSVQQDFHFFSNRLTKTAPKNPIYMGASQAERTNRSARSGLPSERVPSVEKDSLKKIKIIF